MTSPGTSSATTSQDLGDRSDLALLQGVSGAVVIMACRAHALVSRRIRK